MSSYTAYRRLKAARKIFQLAVEYEVLSRNPFQGVGLRAKVQDRKRYIPAEDVLRVIQAAPNVDWRIIIALVRFAGLRCPTEVFSLKWEHVRFDQGVMHVPQPKVAHLPDKEKRVVPIFGPLRPFLDEAWQAATPGQEYVVADDTYRKAAWQNNDWRRSNPATQFKRIIRRAGLEPWPKPFHNLRASFCTDLAQQFPQHVVLAWCGHTQDVAQQHYLQVTEQLIQQAQHWRGPATASRETAALPAAEHRGNGPKGAELASQGGVS